MADMKFSMNVHRGKLQDVKELPPHTDTITVKIGGEDEYQGITFFWTLEELENIAIRMYTEATAIRFKRETAQTVSAE